MTTTTTPLTFDTTFIEASKHILRDELPDALRDNGLGHPEGTQAYVTTAVDNLDEVWKVGSPVRNIATRIVGTDFSLFCDGYSDTHCNDYTLADYVTAGCDVNEFDLKELADNPRGTCMTKLLTLPGLVLRTHYLRTYDIDLFKCNEPITFTFDTDFITDAKQVLRDELPDALEELKLGHPGGVDAYVDAACNALDDVWGPGNRVSNIATLQCNEFAAFCEDFTLVEYITAGCDPDAIDKAVFRENESITANLCRAFATDLRDLPILVLRAHYHIRYGIDIMHCHEVFTVPEHKNTECKDTECKYTECTPDDDAPHFVFDEHFVKEACNVLTDRLPAALIVNDLGFPDDTYAYIDAAQDSLTDLWVDGEPVYDAFLLEDIHCSEFAQYCDGFTTVEYITAGCVPTGCIPSTPSTATPEGDVDFDKKLHDDISYVLRSLPYRVLRAYYLEQGLDIADCGELFVIGETERENTEHEDTEHEDTDTFVIDRDFVERSKQILRDRLPGKLAEYGLVVPDGHGGSDNDEYVLAACDGLDDVWRAGNRVADLHALPDATITEFAKYCNKFLLGDYVAAGCDFDAFATATHTHPRKISAGDISRVLRTLPVIVLGEYYKAHGCNLMACYNVVIK